MENKVENGKGREMKRKKVRKSKVGAKKYVYFY